MRGSAIPRTSAISAERLRNPRVSTTMAVALLPADIRKALWDQRKKIRAIQVISDEPSYSLGLLFWTIPTPIAMAATRRFPAELRLVRWLHNTSWPPARFTLGTKRCYHVIFPTIPIGGTSFPVPPAKERC